MEFHLTPRGAVAVAAIKSRYQNLQAEGCSERNAFDRACYDNGHHPAAVAIYAIGVPSSDDFDAMIKQGYAER